MICQRMMVGGGGGGDVWQFTVDTEATAAGEKKTGIPFNLYGQDSVTLDVDWGDGTTSRLTSADYAETDSTASVHEYGQAGEYTVLISCNKWEDAYILAMSQDSPISTEIATTAPVYWFRRTLLSVDSILPRMAGEKYYEGGISGTTLGTKTNSLAYLFTRCAELTDIPDGFFDKNQDITDLNACFDGCVSLSHIPVGLLDELTLLQAVNFLFYNCSSLLTIPSGLFMSNAKLEQLGSCFEGCGSISSIPENLLYGVSTIKNLSSFLYGCASLVGFTLRISSQNVQTVSYFVKKKSGATRTIYVPSGSTTETTFNAVASDLGLTIIGE